MLQMKALAILSIGLGFLVTPVDAQELRGTLKKIKETGAVNLGYRESSIPFSYLDGQNKPVGYAMDICEHIVGAIKNELKLDKVQVDLTPVTSATRIPLMANGTIDLECGSTTNNVERQKQVGYTYTHFLTTSRYVTKAANRIASIDDLRGKTIVTTAGTTNMKQVTVENAARNLGMTILPAKEHAEAFLMVETDRAIAFVMDDILLASLVATSKSPKDYVISSDSFSLPEPYGIMLRKDDADFKRIVDKAVAELFGSPEGVAIYNKWFTSPVPPRGINLNTPMSDALRKIYAKPSDSPDPASY
jgi:glutamate/aspartate transport system substrate-binding protein